MQAKDCKDQPFSPKKILQIKQDDILFSNQSSKVHTSKDEASFRVLYYGGASGTVPFTWETRPGTPKHPLFEENPLPPLTPPPSYLSTPKTNKNRNPKIFNFNFFRNSKSNKEKSLFSLSSTSSSSSNSVPSMSRNVYAGSIDHYSFNKDKDQKTPEKSSVTAMCFGGSGNRSAGGNFGMFRRRVKSLKNAVPLIRGSGTESKF